MAEDEHEEFSVGTKPVDDIEDVLIKYNSKIKKLCYQYWFQEIKYYMIEAMKYIRNNSIIDIYKSYI